MKQKIIPYIFFVLAASALPVQQTRAQTDAANWKTSVGTVSQKEFVGRKALYVDRGVAYLPASHFDDGVIEVDIAGAVMAGITFRVNESFDYEEAYIRIPKSGGRDALQYGPVFNGEFSWQFYPEYQAMVVYPSSGWVHLKIMVKNKQAAVYAAGSDTATLLVDSLRIPNSSGHVGVWSLSTGAYFSNFTYRPLSATDQFPVITTSKARRNRDAIAEWLVSEAAEFHTEPGDLLPEKQAAHSWKKATTEPDGYLNINRYARKKVWGVGLKNSTDLVWLRHEWEEEKAGLKPFSFEYGNRCSIYLNNHKVFAGNNSFLLKGPFYRGDIDKEMKANTLYLPVQKGKNTLYIAVTGTSNGWGFMGQWKDGSLMR